MMEIIAVIWGVFAALNDWLNVHFKDYWPVLAGAGLIYGIIIPINDIAKQIKRLHERLNYLEDDLKKLRGR